MVYLKNASTLYVVLLTPLIPILSHLDAMQGSGEARTELYTQYSEGVLEPLTQQRARSQKRSNQLD